MDGDSNTPRATLQPRVPVCAEVPLDALNDVDQRLRELYREIEHDTPPPEGDDIATRRDQADLLGVQHAEASAGPAVVPTPVDSR